MLPLDGNPNKTIGMIAHPGKVQCITAIENGAEIMTAGGDQIGTINNWVVNYGVYEAEQELQSR